MKWPTSVGCPFCPAQSYPSSRGTEYTVKDALTIRQFICPASHKFWVEPEVSRETPSQ